MLKPYDLLENVLIDVEKGIREGINVNALAKKYAISVHHLRKLFKFAFKQSLTDYIRSRKLTASLEELLKTDLKIFDIALEYGFGYEQTYIRAFKLEFGTTPGDLRKLRKSVRVKLPLYLLSENKFSDGLFFGPDIVMVPQFHVIGKLHRLSDSHSYSIALALEAGSTFWKNERTQIKTVINDNVYLGITRMSNNYKEIIDYMSAVQVENLDEIPQGFSAYTFEASLCAKFRYIGQHYHSELNRDIVNSIFETIFKFSMADHFKYSLPNDNVFFGRLDTGLSDRIYCQMEWFIPIVEKK